LSDTNGRRLRVVRDLDAEEVIPTGPDISRAEMLHAEYLLNGAIARLSPSDRQDLGHFFGLAPPLRIICMRLAFFVSDWLPDPERRGHEYARDSGLLVRCLKDGVARLRGHPDYMGRPAKQAFLYGLFSAAVKMTEWRVWSPKAGVPDDLPPPPCYRREPQGLTIEVWEPLIVPLSRWVDRRAGRAPYLNPVDPYTSLSPKRIADHISSRILGLRVEAQLDWESIISRLGD